MAEQETEYTEGAGRLEGQHDPRRTCPRCLGGGHALVHGESKICPDCEGRGKVLPEGTDIYPAR